MKKHKLYFTDELGRFNGYDRVVLFINQSEGVLQIGHQLRIPLSEIVAVEVRSLPKNPKSKYLAIDVSGPSLEKGEPTTIKLVHKDFFTRTKIAQMQAVVEELMPLIQANAGADLLRIPDPTLQPRGAFQAQYVLNVSLLITFHRKLWYAYDKPSTIARKTLFLMFLGGIVNVFGVLLVAAPFDNFRMSLNLRTIGWSTPATLIAYLALSYPAVVLWLVILIRWATKHS